MKTKLLVMMLVAGGSMFAQTRFSVGINFGGPRYAPPVAVAAYRPMAPGPGYVWVDGYTDEYGNWVDGYWALPPYAGAYWVAPRYYSGRFVAGYWGGERHFDRDDFRFRGHEFREHDFDRGRSFDHYRGRSFDHDRGRSFDRDHGDRGRDFGRGFRR